MTWNLIKSDGMCFKPKYEKSIRYEENSQILMLVTGEWNKTKKYHAIFLIL